jgi:superfamily II RNA helicase
LVTRVFGQTPPRPGPRDWERRTRSLAAELGDLKVSELVERERSQGPEAALASVECHRCPWGAQHQCDRAWKEREGLERRLAQKREALHATRNAYWQEFLAVVDVLERFHAVERLTPEGGKLLPKGQLVASLRHDNELLVAEMITRGVLEDATLPEVAALCSCLIEESRSGDAAVARLFLTKRPKLRRRVQALEGLAFGVADAQRQRRLGMPVHVSTGFMPSVFRWTSGDDDWSSIVEESFGGHEGDLIRAMRRLIDLLRQLGEAPEVPEPVATLLARAARVVDRGIVLESALI